MFNDIADKVFIDQAFPLLAGIHQALFTDPVDKTTPRLIQFHTLKNAVNPPFLGGFSIFNTVVA